MVIDTDPDTTGQWWTVDLEVGVHVVPTNDLAPHHTINCPCHPAREMQVHDCDGIGHARFLVTHNSFDGREET